MAIAIPVFTSQLEKSRESTDAANIRNEYAEIMVEILENPQTSITSNHTVTLMQAQNSWQNNEVKNNLAKLSAAGDASKGDLSVSIKGDPQQGGVAALTYTPASGSNAPFLQIEFSKSTE